LNDLFENLHELRYDIWAHCKGTVAGYVGPLCPGKLE